MNLLGIDFGTKNIGLAKAQTDVKVVLPFGVIHVTDTSKAQRELAQLIVRERIDKIIIGLPFGLDGSENANTKKIRDFISDFETQIKIPVECISEIFSSQAGDRMGAGVSRDEKAAMIILQDYLDRKS